MKKVVYFIALVLHFVVVEVVETLSELYPEATESGAWGFGSTGIK